MKRIHVLSFLTVLIAAAACGAGVADGSAPNDLIAAAASVRAAGVEKYNVTQRGVSVLEVQLLDAGGRATGSVHLEGNTAALVVTLERTPSSVPITMEAREKEVMFLSGNTVVLTLPGFPSSPEAVAALEGDTRAGASLLLLILQDPSLSSAFSLAVAPPPGQVESSSLCGAGCGVWGFAGDWFCHSLGRCAIWTHCINNRCQ